MVAVSSAPATPGRISAPRPESAMITDTHSDTAIRPAERVVIHLADSALVPLIARVWSRRRLGAGPSLSF